MDKKLINNNLSLWLQVERTNPNFVKNFKGKGGFKGTAICAQWQKFKATELWGCFGDKWGVKNETYEFVDTSDNFHNKILVYQGTFYYPNGSFRIAVEIDVWQYSSMYKTWSKVADIYKKVATDGLTKALSMLGFSADVFMGKFDDNKYVQQLREEYLQPEVTEKAETTDKKSPSDITNEKQSLKEENKTIPSTFKSIMLKESMRIGIELFKKKLGAFGYEKIEEMKDRKLQKEFYKIISILPDKK